MIRHWFSALLVWLGLGSPLAWADPPVASYIFPAGAQRGTSVKFKVGGLNLHKSCGFEMLGPGVEAGGKLQRVPTVWFEGPLLPLPDSQRQEDYPQDLAGQVKIAADAPQGTRHWRLWTDQGATPAMKFLIGELPELVEEEIEGDPIPVEVKLPLTINGRVFPREDVDIWSFTARKGQAITCELYAARLGSPLDARLEVRDAAGRRLAENNDDRDGDPWLRFTAPADGRYQVRIHDINFSGGQAFVYRLTMTAEPHVDRIYPLGGRRGEKVRFEVAGQALPAELVEIALPTGGPADYSHRLALSGKRSNPVTLELDDLPEHREAEPNAQREQVKPVPLPAILNGRIDTPGDVDYWAIAARKGEVLEIDLRAARLGSPLSGVLALVDATGKELARAENAGGQADPLLRFTAPADATYWVRVEERFRARGGAAFAYRLRIAPPAAPDFRLQLAADALTLLRDGQVKLKVNAERLGGFADAIALDIAGMPKGVTAMPTTIAAKQATVDLTFKAEKTAVIQASRLTIRGSAPVGGKAVTRTAARDGLDSVLLAVAVPTPFKIVGDYDMRWASRGSVHQRRYRIERNGFDGPIEVCMADRQARHLQGVTGPTITVPAGATEFSYAVSLPPWMETGRTCRVCVMGIGLVKDADGGEHVVTYSSVQQNEQIVAVVEPGRLSMEVSPESLLVEPGKNVVIKVEVTRAKGMQGQVKLELQLAAHLRGIAAEPVTIPAGQSSATFTVRFTTEARGPFNVPMVVRATIMDKGEPVIAETKVALEPEPGK